MVTNEADGDPIAGPDRLDDPQAHAGPASAGGVEETEDRICGLGRNIRSLVPATMSSLHHHPILAACRLAERSIV